MDKQVTNFNTRLRTIRLREFFVWVVVTIIIGGVIMAIFPVFEENDDLFFILISSLILIFFFWCLKDTTGLSKNFEDLFLEKNRKEILYIFAINICFAFIFLFLVTVLDFAIGMVDPTWVTGFDFDKIDLTPGAFLLSSITTLIFAPIMEELAFRGILFNRLKIKIGFVPAMIISSLIFAAGHDFGGIISAFLFGICMCILYLKTDNILIPISVHFINNVAASLLDIVNADAFLCQFPWIMLLGGIVGVSTILLIKYIIDETNALKRAYS